MPTPNATRFIQAVRRSYKTPQSVLQKLGLDQSLLDDPSSEMSFEKTDAALAAIREMVAKMDPDEREHFLQLLEESDLGELLLGSTTATDEPPPVPGMPTNKGTVTPLAFSPELDAPRLRAAADRYRRAQDAAFDARMGSAATRRAPALALDNTAHNGFNHMFPGVKRIGHV